MKNFLVAYAATATAFLVLDGLWLGVVAKNFYAAQLGALMRDDIFKAPAALFYLCYAAGLVVIAVRPLDAGTGLITVALYGALVGFLAYGTYDMTNLSTLRNWPLAMSVVDLCWGTLLSASCAVIGALALRAWA